MKRTTIMRKLSFVTLAVTSFIAAGAVAAPGINSKYNIRGDRAIAPIQVFDDGQRMFLQLRRTDIPPVPIDNESGRPLSYTIDGPYMVISALPAAVVLRYGQREATVLSTTREIRTAPSGGLTPAVPAGGGLFFGAAPTAKETPPAADPIPAASAAAAQAKTAPAAAPAAPIVRGSFEVAASHPKSSFIAHKVKFDDKSLRMTPSEIVALSSFVQQNPGKALVVEAPAGADGEKRAAEVRRQLMRLGVKDSRVSVEIGAMSHVQVLAEKG